MIPEYKYELKSKNSDATKTYNITGKFPVPFKDFFKYILNKVYVYRIEFNFKNRSLGGWTSNKIEIYKDRESGKCYWKKQVPENLYEQIKDVPVICCSANGAWGQMGYWVTLDDEVLERVIKK